MTSSLLAVERARTGDGGGGEGDIDEARGEAVAGDHALVGDDVDADPEEAAGEAWDDPG